MYDLAIIGGGPAGYVAAEKAGAAGLGVVLFEKRELGGVCLNEGCIPTKTLLYSAKMYDHASGGKKYGITVGDVSYEYKKIADRKTKVVRKLVAGIKMKMEAAGVTVVRGEAVIERGDAQSVAIACDGQVYEAKNLLICTGSEAFVPPIPGIDGNPAVLTNREMLALTEAPATLVVIGGGVIGMEFASFCNSLGIPVTVIEMMPEILGGMDKEVSEALRTIYAKRGVKFCLQCKVTRVEGNTVFYTDADGNVDQQREFLPRLLRFPLTQRAGNQRGAAAADHKTDYGQSHQIGPDEVDAGKGSLANQVGNEQAVHHAVNGGEDHHDDGGHHKAQQAGICKMVGKLNVHGKSPLCCRQKFRCPRKERYASTRGEITVRRSCLQGEA